MHCRVNSWMDERVSGLSGGEAMRIRKKEDAFISEQNGRMDLSQSSGIKRKRAGIETEDGSEELVRTVFGAEALRYSPEDSFEGSHEEREIFTSFFPTEEEPWSSSENTGREDTSVEDSIESRTTETEDALVEDGIESGGLSSTGTVGNNEYTSTTIELAAPRDDNISQRGRSPMIKFRERGFNVGKAKYRDKKDHRFSGTIYNSMRIRKKIRSMDNALEEIKSLQDFKRKWSVGANSGPECLPAIEEHSVSDVKKAGQENGKTIKISAKDILLSEGNGSDLQDNDASSYKLQADFEKLNIKKMKEHIMQREQNRRTGGKVLMNHKHDNIVDNCFSASRARRLNQRLTSPIVESSEGGVLLSRYVDGNSSGITACNRFNGDRTIKNLGHKTSTFITSSTKAEVLLQHNEARGSAETMDNTVILRLANYNLASKIGGGAELDGKNRRKSMLKRSQTISLPALSKERQTGKKSAIAELRKSLRERAKDHLLAAGWKIKFKPRTGRDYQDSVYVSPWGSSFWSLPKAWSALRQRLDANGRMDESFSSLMQATNEKKLRGKGSCFWSGLKDTLMHLDSGKQNLGASAIASDQVSEGNPFMTMLLTEDLSLLKRKKKDKSLEDVEKKDKYKEYIDNNDKYEQHMDKKDNNNKNSMKRVKNGQILPFVKSQHLLKEEKRGPNLDGLCIASPETQVCDQRSVHAKLATVGEQRGMHGNLSHAWELRSMREKLSCVGELRSICGELSDAEEKRSTYEKFLHAKDLRCIHRKPLDAGEQRSLHGRLLHACDGKPLRAGGRKLLHAGDESSLHGKLLNDGEQRSIHGKLLHSGDDRRMNRKLFNAGEQRGMCGTLSQASNGWGMHGKSLMNAEEQRSIHRKMLHSGNQSRIHKKLLDVSDEGNMHGKLAHVAELKDDCVTQGKTNAKIAQQHKPAESLQDEHSNKGHTKGPSNSQKENSGNRDTQLPLTKNLHGGMEKQHVLCMAVDLKASGVINGLQNLNGRQTSYPETGRESNESGAGHIGGKLNEPRVGQAGRKSNEPEPGRESDEPEKGRILSDPGIGQMVKMFNESEMVRKFKESEVGRKSKEPQEAQAGRELIKLEGSRMSNEPEAGGKCNEQLLGRTGRRADELREGRLSSEPALDRKCSDLREGQTGIESGESQAGRVCIKPHVYQEGRDCIEPKACEEGRKTNELQACPEGRKTNEPQAGREVEQSQAGIEFNEPQAGKRGTSNEPEAGKLGVSDEPQAGREFDELQSGKEGRLSNEKAGIVSSEVQADRKSNELQAGQVGGKYNEPQADRISKEPQRGQCLKINTENSRVRVECKPMLKKGGASIDDDDDDILLSSLIKKRKCGLHIAKGSAGLCDRSRIIAGKTKSLHGKKKRKHRGACVLLVRSSGKGANHSLCDKSLSFTNRRTVLSWLIDVGAVSENEMVQYLNKKSNRIMKDGWVTRDGILCKCCNRVFTISNFKTHAGSKVQRPCSNIFLESGKSLAMCQIQAWSAEYKSRKAGMRVIEVDESDQNDDACGLCGDGGNLICCDKCPSTFHQDCLALKDIPEGNWYCPNCTCAICGTVGHDEETHNISTMLICDQCEHKYHKKCLQERDIQAGGSKARTSGFCGQDCEKVSAGLNRLLGISNPIAEGFSWTLLRCIDEDQKACSSQRLALMAECNAKLAVALAVMEECFEPMVDPRTDIDMIPHVVYNSGSNFNRLNYQGFYTVVLEKGGEVISVASIRIHGGRLAEMPLIGTCHQYRRQGMCRRLVNAIEEMLMSLKVEKLILSAIPDLLETWTTVFGFKPLEDSHKEEIRHISMMMFPGTTLLQKSIFKLEMTKDDEIVGKHADQLRCFKGDHLNAQEQEDNARVSVPEKTRTDSTCCVPGDITDVNTRIETTVSRLFPETREILKCGKVLDKKLAAEEERTVSQWASGQADMESAVHLEAEGRITSEDASSDLVKGKVLDAFAYRLYLGAQHIGDAAIVEGSIAGLNSANLDTIGTSKSGDNVYDVEKNMHS